MSADREWTPPSEKPGENLRALVRRLDAGTSTDEIIRLARIHFPRWRTTEPRVETICEQVADAHELARVHRWFAEQDDPPAVTLTDERCLCPADTDGVVHRAEIDTIVAHRLRGRAPRTCENPDGVIDCHGPDGFGYRCPGCGQQRRREQAIIDELLLVVKRDRLDDSRQLTVDRTENTLDNSPDAAPTSSADAPLTADGGTLPDNPTCPNCHVLLDREEIAGKIGFWCPQCRGFREPVATEEMHT